MLPFTIFEQFIVGQRIGFKKGDESGPEERCGW
jgi:hypothetical protein